MTNGYIVHPGSIAHEAIQCLRDHGALSTIELARHIGRHQNGIPKLLEQALESGYVENKKKGTMSVWSLGPRSLNEELYDEDGPADGSERRVVLNSEAKTAASVFAYADQRGAAPFSVALSTDGRMMVERHGRLLLELSDAERKTLVGAASNGVVPN